MSGADDRIRFAFKGLPTEGGLWCGGTCPPSHGHRFRVAGQGLPGDVLPEIALLMGEVPCVPYATAVTPSLGNAAEPFLDRHVALLLANHGALTWGRDLAQARIRMESLEHGARILMTARALGAVNHLTRDQIDVLERMRGTPSHGQNDNGY